MAARDGLARARRDQRLRRRAGAVLAHEMHGERARSIIGGIVRGAGGGGGAAASVADSMSREDALAHVREETARMRTAIDAQAAYVEGLRAHHTEMRDRLAGLVDRGVRIALAAQRKALGVAFRRARREVRATHASIAASFARVPITPDSPVAGALHILSAAAEVARTAGAPAPAPAPDEEHNTLLGALEALCSHLALADAERLAEEMHCAAVRALDHAAHIAAEREAVHALRMVEMKTRIDELDADVRHYKEAMMHAVNLAACGGGGDPDDPLTPTRFTYMSCLGAFMKRGAVPAVIEEASPHFRAAHAGEHARPIPCIAGGLRPPTPAEGRSLSASDADESDSSDAVEVGDGADCVRGSAVAQGRAHGGLLGSSPLAAEPPE